MFRLSADRVLVGDRLEPLAKGALLIDGDKIVALGPDASVDSPPTATRYDLGQATILPGLIDAHMHTFGLASTGLHELNLEREPYRALRASFELSQLLRAGFTSARCLGSSIGPDLRRAIEEGFVEGPRLVAAGEFISSTGGTWDAGPLPSSWARERTSSADGGAAVVQAVRERVRAGADFIKLGLSKGRGHDHNKAWGDDPFAQALAFSVEEVRAAVEEAHRNLVPVSAHAIGEAAVSLALDGGIDIIEHGYGISEETRARLVEAQTPVVTTIAQLHFHRAAYEPFNYSPLDREIYDRHWFAMHDSFVRGLAAGVNFVLGTDLIGAPTHPLRAAAMEFKLAVEWGMDRAAALQAGTIGGAKVLRVSDTTGSLAVGKRADILAVLGNPLEDIGVLLSPDLVLKAGRIAFSATWPGAQPSL